jgi:murein DD-endopeptidase MepM/ murein hydrolase activator NlpD
MVRVKILLCAVLVLAVAPPTSASSSEVNEVTPADTNFPISRGPRYVFPFAKVPVYYPRDHLHYPAVDVEGCYARVLAPTSGVISEVRTHDKWDPLVDEPGTRGGLTITMHGDDTVRYYFSHLGKVKVRKGQRVQPGHWIGVIGSSGNARVTRCHVHLGMSRICHTKETILQQGEFWPQKYLDAWKEGRQLSPRKEKNQVIKRSPRACLSAADSYVEEMKYREKRSRDKR